MYYGHAEIVKLLNQQKNLTPEDNELFKENLYKIINDESKSIQNHIIDLLLIDPIGY